jgi:hypothetical protein
VEARKIFGSKFDLSHFQIFWLSGSQTCFIMQYEYAMPWRHVGPMRSSPKENIANYRWCMCSRWQIALIPVVSSKRYDLLKHC